MLRDAFISAANNLSDLRQEVDALNVFPVPDGDTGTNMSMTLSAARRELEIMSDTATVAEVAQTAASALLRGARGNSGVITSLLFRGFAKGLAGKKEANARDMAKALEIGVEAAYKAVMKPTEGTILTVARLAAEHASEIVTDEMEVVELWREVIIEGEKALQSTPDLLPVLKKAGVVDAGGKGFIIIAEGMLRVFEGNGIITASDVQTKENTVNLDTTAFSHAEEDITFTYCTEFIILKEDKDVQYIKFRAYLESIGDSVVVVDDDDIIKCHVHTDNPGDAMQAALKLGMITKIKIENMREQFMTLNKKAMDAKNAEDSEEFPYAQVSEDTEFGFVCVSAGEGLKQLFIDLGADNVVSGGQTMNPSTDDILKAIHATPAKTVFVLPNNKNIIMAAEQAIKLADRRVVVLPTRTIPQGISAILAFDPTYDYKENSINMSKAFERVGTGLITFAARDSNFDGHKIKKGELLALDGSKLLFTDTDLEKTVVKLTKTIAKRDTYREGCFVTLIYGKDIELPLAEAIQKAVEAKLPENAEVALVDGGQPVYYFMISVE